MSEPEDRFLGINAYAEHRNVHMKTVQKAIAKGKISYEYKSGRKMIDWKKADKEWEQNHVKEWAGADVYGTNSDGEFPKDGPPKEVHPNIRVQESYIKAYRARLAKLELDQKLGNVIDRSQVYNEVQQTMRVVREALLQIPMRVAPDVTSMVDPTDIENKLYEEIERVLNELSELAKRYE